MLYSENSSFSWSLIDDRKSEALFKVSFKVFKQDSHFATSLLLQPFIPEMNLSKATRCHYYRQKSPGSGNELLSSEEDSKE